MKQHRFVIFISVVLVTYACINLFIWGNAVQALPETGGWRGGFTAGFAFVALAYPLGRALEAWKISVVSQGLVWTGSFWLAAMFYSLLIVSLIDLGVISNLVVDWLPLSWRGEGAGMDLMLGSAAVVGLAVAAGHWNASHPRVRRLELDIGKPANGLEKLDIAMASDIHMGTQIGIRRVNQLVAMMNGLNPDLILLAGDEVDEDLGPVIRQNLGDALSKLKAPLGVYGITGNHEYIGGAEAAVKYLREHGITMLRDEVVKVADAFWLAGREDRMRPLIGEGSRLEVATLLAGVDKTLPVLLMDHQPAELHKAEAAGVDLQVSGHTHHGQLWPLNYLTQRLFEVSTGHKLKGRSHFYVSTGFGTWGPPVRLGNRPEIVHIRLRFLKSTAEV